jgi:monoamine oxidase
MRRIECDIAIIGAGVAGLAATSRLTGAGKNVICLEAAGRIGGRVLTLHDSLTPIPIELGAEFVHGLPPETWKLINQARMTAYEHTPKALHIDRGRVLKEKTVGEIADRVLSKMGKSDRTKDESFEDYQERSRQPADVKRWARIHIEGFNAARKDLISAASLTEDADAAEVIEGDRTFRILNGYDSVPLAMLQAIPNHHSIVHLNSVVERVNWRRGLVNIQYTSILDKQTITLRCRQLIVTVPLGVLQAVPSSRGAIHFDPEPGRILRAAASLQFGRVYRVTFRFPTAFWEQEEKFKGAGFLISRDKEFFTWWTTHPIMSPLLTGWTAGSAAIQFQGMDESQITIRALESLARILKRKVPKPEAVYFHNWQADPFFRGAYSYVPAGHLAARRALAQPVEETLYVAGEAADLKGHSGTVHGAIASGIRAAERVLASGG